MLKKPSNETILFGEIKVFIKLSKRILNSKIHHFSRVSLPSFCLFVLSKRSNFVRIINKFVKMLAFLVSVVILKFCELHHFPMTMYFDIKCQCIILKCILRQNFEKPIRYVRILYIGSRIL